jgi:hypothetical protein
MATSYTSLLGFALPVTGELSGTWGTVVNDNITKLVEDSIAGTATAAVTSADWTLSTTGSGAANEARAAILIPTGTPGTTRNIIAPEQSKAYIVDNQSDGAVVVKGASTTGATVAAGTTALVVWNGSDFVLVSQALANATGTLPVSKGGTGATTLTANNVLLGNGTSAPLTVAPGTNGNILTSNGTTWTSASAPSFSQVYPGAGVAVSTGTAWDTSITLGTGVSTFLTTPSSANLAAAVTDETGTGALVFGTTPVLVGSRITVSALGTLTTGTTTLDLATAQVYTATITASNTITIAFSNAPSSGQSQVVLLRLIDAGGGTIVWPANTKFTAGTAPTLTASGVDVLGVYYDVTTTTYMVFVIGLDVKVP